MPEINEKDFLDEIRYDIKVKDILKAKIVMTYLEEMKPEVVRAALSEIGKADINFAVHLLAEVLMDTPEEAKTYPPVKQLLISRILDDPQVLLDILRNTKEKLATRLLFIGLSGEIRLPEATPFLLKILKEEEGEKILKGAINAAGMIGIPSAAAIVADYLYVDSFELIACAISALGQIGTRSALHRLAERIGIDPDLDIMIVDIFARNQSQDALEKLNETITSHYAHVRTAGKAKLVEIGSKVVPILTNNLLHFDSDLLIHTLNVLGDIRDEAAVDPIRKLLYNEPKDPNIRFAAYEALGLLPLQKGAFSLASGLDDSESHVRAAAARAIDRNYNTVLLAGMKNLVNGSKKDAERVITTIIDTQCGKIFLSLMDDDQVKKIGISYLVKKAHPDIKSYFKNLLIKNGYEDIAEDLDATKKKAEKKRPKVFAVDDSKMILSIYRKVLHSLGYEPVLFEFPEEAVDKVKQEKPDIILTDLNMPKINGIELIRRVRKGFDKKKLPIIMVTTQNEAMDNEAADKAGVNAILHKPFTEESIGKAIASFINVRN